MITPEEYFAEHPTACKEAVLFCRVFSTMRAAWLSDRVRVSYMLWALGRHPEHMASVLQFAAECVKRADGYAAATPEHLILGAAHNAARCAAHCAGLARVYFEEGAYGDAADAAADTAANAVFAAYIARNASSVPDNADDGERSIQRDALRRMFPQMFLT